MLICGDGLCIKFAGPANGAVGEITHAEAVGDGAWIRLLRNAEGGIAGDDKQVAEVRELHDEIVGDAFGKPVADRIRG